MVTTTQREKKKHQLENKIKELYVKPPQSMIHLSVKRDPLAARSAVEVE